ncbi:glycosyltransferase family 4 protein [Geomonas sp. RF6]|uniref:glycosyltransferase family 4 protein n=1 Tax=Geomonas sp. RF6 TaxID=2897342 RepID=UPI001E2A785E|nr:glycosyltransferase family 4 protein [Geomonas sp. RF6]UFS72118.1 glycosyltransferase family 4 protein [Geomonas sp. RF6]
MRIALVSPLYESVPPRLYGGTERIVAYLVEELVLQGHEVTLFASGDSRTSARLVPCSPQGLRLDKTYRDPAAYHLLMAQRVCRVASDFDVVHFNIEFLHYPLTRLYRFPNVTTLHSRLDLADLFPLYQEYREVPVVSISDSQRAPLPFANWQGTVYHGLPPGLLQLNDRGDAYLAFLGRVSPEKGLDSAIAIARGSGIRLKIAAKVDPWDKEYFATVIRPLIDGKDIEFIGEISEGEKQEFLGNALALLLPLHWDEPFGLVMIEAMACGTPAIVFARGSAPEVVRNGVGGFLVRDEAEAIEAVRKVEGISRRSCREYFEARFLARRMAEDYLALYQKVIDNQKRLA